MSFSQAAPTEPKQKFNEIVDIRNEKDWEYLLKDAKVPVVIDFYANWCGPCKKLTPILEEKAKAANGKWILGKVDIDELPQLANAIKIRSVPTVILVHGGNLIDNFTGLPDESVLNTFFETVYKLASVGFSIEKGEKILQDAVAQLEKGNYGEAINSMKSLLTEEMWVEKRGAYTTALLGLAFAKSGDEAHSLTALTELSNKYEKDIESEEIKEIVKKIQIEFVHQKEKSNDVQELINKLEKDPGNNEIRYELAEASLKKQDYDTAIQAGLDILKIDRNWNNKKAQKFLLDLFQKLGSTNPKVVAGRKAMQKILF